jgi:hypothetical protein
MIRFLLLLLDLLTNFQAVEALTRNVLTLGLANTAIACLLGSFEIVHRVRFRQNTSGPSQA